MTREQEPTAFADADRPELGHLYARYLLTRALVLTPPPPGERSHDAVDGAGIRYRVFGHRIRMGSGRIAVPALPDRAFDRIVSVLFGSRFEVRAARMAWVEPYLRAATREAGGHAWTLPVDDPFWTGPEVDDLTAVLQATLAQIARTPKSPASPHVATDHPTPVRALR